MEHITKLHLIDAGRILCIVAGAVLVGIGTESPLTGGGVFLIGAGVFRFLSIAVSRPPEPTTRVFSS